MRRFFRFSVRDLLWLTLVVAVGLGWFVRERQLRTDANQARAEANLARRHVNWWRSATQVLCATLSEANWEVQLRSEAVTTISPTKKQSHHSMPEGPAPKNLHAFQ